MNSVNHPVIVYQFADMRTALEALDIFEELGYDPSLVEADGQPPKVAIRIIREDITSALEIGQAFGGTLLENEQGPEEGKAYEMAYDLQEGALLSAEHRDGLGDADRLDAGNDVGGPVPEIPGSDEGPLYDVSADTYDYFSGDVRA